MGEHAFSIKLDIGAACTVISVDNFVKHISPDEKIRLEQFCEKRCSEKRKFVSASGDEFWGYQVIAHGVIIDNTVFYSFVYYLVIHNKRSIALLGVDFLDNAEYEHKVHDSIEINGFDDAKYGKEDIQGIENDEIISFIDGISA